MDISQLEQNLALTVQVLDQHQNKIEELDDKVSEIIDILSSFSKAMDNTQIMDTERR